MQEHDVDDIDHSPCSKKKNRKLYPIFFGLNFVFVLFMQLLLKILTGMENRVDPEQTAPSLIWVCTVCICHSVRNFGVRNGF